MRIANTALSRSKFSLIFVVLTASLFQFTRIFMGLTENHSFRQSQTVSLVRSFMRFGFDWKSPQNIFGNSPIPVPFEFPLFQYISASIGQILNIDPIYATRLTNLILFQLSAILGLAILAQLNLTKYQFAFILLFEFTPFGFNFGHAALIEFLPVCLMLFALFQYNAYLRSSQNYSSAIHIAIFTVALVLSFLSKFTTAFALIPLFLLSCNLVARRSFRKWIPFFFGLGLALVISYIWIYYSDAVKSENSFTDLLTSSALKHWNYGDIRQRISPFTWDVIFNQNFSSISGGLGISIAALVIFVRKIRKANIVLPIFLSIVLAPLVFTNLYFSHDYYLCAIYFPSILMLSMATVEASSFMRTHLEVSRVQLLVISIILLTSISSKFGHAYLAHSFFIPHDPPQLVKILSHYENEENIILIDCDWDPTIAYYLDRSVLMIPNWPIRNIHSLVPESGIIASCNYPNPVSYDRVYTALGQPVMLNKIVDSVFSFKK